MTNYVPTDWKDEIVDGAGNVVQKGTPLSAANLNNLESGIVSRDAKVEVLTTQLADTVHTTQSIEHFKRLAPEGTDSPRFQRLLESLDATYSNPIRVPADTYYFNVPVVAKTNGVFFMGDSAQTTIFRPTADFAGEAFFHFKNENNLPQKGIGMANIYLDMEGKNGHGVVCETAYDMIYFYNVDIRNVADNYSAMRFIPNPNYVYDITQGIFMFNVHGNHKNATATAPTFYFDTCQEINLIGVKGWGGYVSKAPSAGFHFHRCRGVTMTGCSAVSSSTAGIKITTTGRNSAGFLIAGCTFENVDKTIVTSSSDTNTISLLKLEAVRHEGSVGAMDLANLVNSYLETQTLTVNIESTCSEVKILTSDPTKITDNGVKTTVVGWNAGGVQSRSFHEIKSKSSPFEKYSIDGKTDFWQTIWNASTSSDFGWLLRYFDGTSNKDIMKVFGSAIYFQPNGVETARFSDASSDTMTGFLVMTNKGGTKTVQRVKIGAIDSGGTGLRALVVDN